MVLDNGFLVMVNETNNHYESNRAQNGNPLEATPSSEAKSQFIRHPIRFKDLLNSQKQSTSISGARHLNLDGEPFQLSFEFE